MLGALLCFVIPALAALTGDFVGTLFDASGAVISGATIGIRNVETGATRTITSDMSGQFAALQLPIGTYEVKVSSSGFRDHTASILIRSGEKTSLNITMALGETTATVVVEGTTSPLLDVATSQVSIALEERAIKDLPTFTRDPLAFASLAPGVIPVTPNNPFLGSGSFNANGQRGRANNITVDNVTSTDVSTTGSAGMGTISLDSIQEFKLITNSFSAEFGRNGGAQVQLITRGGTNNYHGTVYWFHQNKVFNSRDFFDTTGEATPFIRNQWGFTAGGPILPQLRDKAFIFGHYEGLKIRGLGDTRTATVLTPTQQAGITDATSQALFAGVGAPTSPTGTITNPASNLTDAFSWSLRYDQVLRGGRDLITVRYSEQTSTNASPGLTFIGTNLVNYGAVGDNLPRTANVSHAHTFTPTLVNDFRFSFGRSRPQFAANTTLTAPFAPVIAITGFATMGISNILPQGRVQNTFQYSDTLSWATGRHGLKFGLDAHRVQANSFFDANFRGTFTFASVADFQAGNPNGFSQRFGTSVRGNRSTDYFTFIQDDYRVTNTLTLNLGLRVESSGGVSEVNGLLSNLNRSSFAPLGGGGSGALGTIELGGSAFRRNTNWAPRLGFAWNPRHEKLVIRGGYGWAYDYIFLNPITNLRFAAPFVPSISINAFTGSNTYANLVAGTAQVQTGAQAAIGVFPSNQVNFGTISPVKQDLKNPRVSQWNLGVQYQVMSDTVVKASYVGTKGDFLQVSMPINLLPAQTIPPPATNEADELARVTAFRNVFLAQNGTATTPSNRIDPRFNAVTQVQDAGSSIYHAFELEGIKRFTRGYSLQASYTWGHSIDNASDVLGVLVNDSAAIEDPRNLANNRGNSQFDVRHRFVMNHRWEIPWAKNLRGVPGKLLDGWAFNGIFQIQSGFPANIFAGTRRAITDVLLVGGSNVRANVNGPLNFTPVPQGSAAAANIPVPCARGVNTTTTSTCTNTSNFLFTQPLLGNIGNLGRNALRLNRFTQFDWAFTKNTYITEQQRIEFRFEMFNVFNNTSFAGFVNTLTSTNFGLYQTTDTNSRRMQFALRYAF
ncbi:MAG: carboxypeptidase regulatory-like domain-containing protein [Candidatus Acidiferrales bacterium]